jgi:hypothetical protein
VTRSPHTHPRRLPDRGLALLLLLISALLPAGCGYSTHEVFPEDVRTVAVPIFGNRTFYQGLEFTLTEAIIKDIELRTPYKVVAEAGADTLLQGTITAVEQSRLSRRRDVALPQEMELRIVVNFEWKNVRSGRVLRDRKGFEAVGRYVPTSPVGERIETGEEDAAQRLAHEIVAVMRGDW